MSITRTKSVKDPLTGEVVGQGKKEMYMQDWRDYKRHPMTEGEQKQRVKWTDACRQASEIIHDQSHPRFVELYERWRVHVSKSGLCMQFPNFVRAVLASE